MTNNKLRLNANKTDFIIIGTSRQRSKLNHFFPANILRHSTTPPDTIRNLRVTVDSDFNFRKHVSLTCGSCFYHIRDLRRIRRYISFSVAKTISTPLITSRLDYCNFLITLHLRIFSVFPFCPTSEISSLALSLFNLASFSNSALLPIKLFLLEKLHVYFPCFP